MNSTKIRKEISLDAQVIERLKTKAEKDGRNLKNYIEKVLIDNANDFVVTEEYKKMMNEILDKKEKGLLKFTPWEDLKKNFGR